MTAVIFAVITLLAVKLTHPWFVGLAITFAAAVVMGRVNERIDPATYADDDGEDDD